ncbi:hypothetical protein [Pseudoalteromonas maricaloris]|uniref:hypothetical protein n=1 Tax=Pseudoalteromonas maricaloris TaxID=184924 RepID=UPI00057F7BEC|nr:hypothetical protein [Pseudoalteromonas flavipulchra]KID35257.1 hypothetical protein QT15_13425 [Pseudoalteromonas flavipulchra NCIMB 2033 = ATCC BAA-314]MBD0780509.1 hypothetical protein [Pseudoalteromonas flavipulchra]MBE0375293.1 hypothetical protein [Pseudoalteromonas flavipulchra NCIMB 2033 = ATCC BAA-314]
MNNQKLLKKYANSFVSSIKPNIKSGYNISASIHPTNGRGATIEFEIVDSKKSKVSVAPAVESVNRTLATIEQRLIDGNIEGVTFAGTNVYMEGNRIVIIKGDDEHSSWDNRAARADVQKVISPKGEN